MTYHKDIIVDTVIMPPWAYGPHRRDPEYVSTHHKITHSSVERISIKHIDDINCDCIWLRGSKPTRKYINKMVRRHKHMCGCRLCGESTPQCLHYHHTDPTNKVASVYKMTSRGYSYFTIKEEIRKCIVICSNCHTKIHCDCW